ncbi:MAG: hypothetical protein AAGH41_02245 [Pseudomonadota bacterium]
MKHVTALSVLAALSATLTCASADDAAQKYPFSCIGATVEENSARSLRCFRTDTRDEVSVVPDGYFMAVTDIVSNRPANDGSVNLMNDPYLMVIGREDDLGGGFSGPKGRNSLTFSGVYDQPTKLTFETPWLVLHSGEKISVANINPNLLDENKRPIQRDGGKQRYVSVFVSGYLISEEAFGG